MGGITKKQRSNINRAPAEPGACLHRSCRLMLDVIVALLFLWLRPCTWSLDEMKPGAGDATFVMVPVDPLCGVPACTLRHSQWRLKSGTCGGPKRHVCTLCITAQMPSRQTWADLGRARAGRSPRARSHPLRGCELCLTAASYQAWFPQTESYAEKHVCSNLPPPDTSSTKAELLRCPSQGQSDVFRSIQSSA
jgi:hypothetical protein